MKILSLFDGIGCAHMAATAGEINIEEYYASEIDPAAIKIASERIPNYTNIGDVRKVKGKDYYFVDIITAGSPCQGFSVSGKRKGMIMKDIMVTNLEQYLDLINKGYSFDLSKGKNQSVLFWEFIRIKNEIDEIRYYMGLPPVHFLLENVKMKPFWEGIINDALGVTPIKINSSKLIPQNRMRWYWINFETTPVYDINPTLDRIIPDAVTGCGWSGRKDKITNKYVPIKSIRKDKIANCITTWSPSKTMPGRQYYINTNGDVIPFTTEDLETLQGYPKGYTKVDGVSDVDRRKAIGNGWTIPVIKHFFDCLSVYYIFYLGVKP